MHQQAEHALARTDAAFETVDGAEEVEFLLAALPAEQRQLARLHWVDQLNEKQVGQAVNRPRGWVAQQLRHIAFQLEMQPRKPIVWDS